MMQRIFSFTLTLMLFTAVISGQKRPELLIKWELAAVLPASAGQEVSLGFAGAINGVNKNALIIAGGANFPDGMPWEGGKKYYSNEIHVLQKNDGKYFWNKKIKSTLPEPIAYCGNTSTEKGIVYAGGENKNGISDRVYLITWNNGKNEVAIKSLPNLPLALTNIALAHIGDVVYAAGGDEAKNSSNRFFSLDLNRKNSKWEPLPDLPIALANATLIAQYGSTVENIYLIGGRTKTSSGISDLHHTTFAFDPIKKIWSTCADISDGKNITNLSAAAGAAIGENYILMVGGDNGETFHKIELLISQIEHAKSPEEKQRLTNEKNALSIQHNGFYKGLLLFNTLTGKWTNIGEYYFPAQVTTTAVKWGNDIVISNGEIKPGVRTPYVVIGKEVINHKGAKTQRSTKEKK